MTTLQLLKKLHNGSYSDERGQLFCPSPYVSTCGRNWYVKLDGDFDLDELKLIVRWMEEHQE